VNLIVLTTRLFGAPMDGGEIGTARLLQALREGGHRVTLLGRGDAEAAAGWCERVISLGAVEPPFATQPFGRRALAVVMALARGQAVTVQRLGTGGIARRVRPWLEGGFDGCIVDRLQAWPWLGDEPPVPAMLLNTNVESDNCLRLARAANRGCHGNTRTRHAERVVMRREGLLLRSLELQVLQQAAAVACVNGADALRLAEIAAAAGVPARARLCALPLYPLQGPAPAAAHEPSGQPRRIGLMGSWTWAPNRAALEWMLRSVWPHLQDRCSLVLAGSGLEGVDVPAGVRLLGRVPDVADFYSAVDLVAIPSLHGSGVQEKAVEALGRGATVVATPHALRDLEPLPPGVHTAERPEAFAALCAEVPLGQAGPEPAAAWSARRREAYAQVLAQCLRAVATPEVSPRGGLRMSASV
jgi:hypothetical protein